MRTAEIYRKTAETEIALKLDLDGSGVSDIASGVGFLDHMLTLFAKHGRFDLTLTCAGDTWVDDHHSVEDIGIARYGSCILPMDEALILTAVDLSGRAYLGYDLRVPTPYVGTFDTELTEEFFFAFVRNAACSLHLRKLAGRNSHHIIEGAFKSAARSLRAAVRIEEAYKDEIPSTKGVL